MANFNVYNGGKKENNDVNTQGIILRNFAQNKGLVIGYWGKSVSLMITDLPDKDQTGFIPTVGINSTRATIAYSTISMLDDICKEILATLKSGGTFEPTATPSGYTTSNVVEISDGSNINMPKGVYLVIYRDLDDNRKTDIVGVYQFESRAYIKNYNHLTGSASKEISHYHEFKDFARFISNAADSFTMATAHTVRESCKSEKLSTFKALSAIAAANGIDLTDTGYSKSKPRRSNPFNNDFEATGTDNNDVEFNIDFDATSHVDLSDI